MSRYAIALIVLLTSATTARAADPSPDISEFVMHHDAIPNFAKSPTIRSTRDGSWSSPSVWSPARLPQDGDIVRVSHDVTYDAGAGMATVLGIASGGRLRFRTDQSSRLSVGTLLVMPGGVIVEIDLQLFR